MISWMTADCLTDYLIFHISEENVVVFSTKEVKIVCWFVSRFTENLSA